ncbi:hypothetical protein [Aggregatilinea lenta]|uniref:hypothetical protein n=1 Tax=Aggregatilinea lenta TaxID=913108 RepID=UPI000E5A6ACA|nr:hypothetical protein [Aggregatilinea lenta]
MIPWTNIEIGQIRVQELRRTADHHRMVRALQAAAPHVPAYGRVLAWVGHRLVTLGARLEGRYSRIHPTPAISMPQVAQEFEHCC